MQSKKIRSSTVPGASIAYYFFTVSKAPPAHLIAQNAPNETFPSAASLKLRLVLTKPTVNPPPTVAAERRSMV